MLVLYIIAAVFVAWVWVDYFRLIDIYEKNSLGLFLLTFVLGGLSVFSVFGAHELGWGKHLFMFDDVILSDLIYSFVGVAFIEEIAKLLPFVLLLLFLKDKVREPIDYLAFICCSALGFSAFENVLYMEGHGGEVLLGRSILCSVGHMFDSALIAYGVILYRFKGKGIQTLLGYFLLAVSAHGFYDFWLVSNKVNAWGWIVSIFYFLITISWFATILNNAINNSQNFTYEIDINSDKISLRLLSYYGLIYVLQFIIATIEYDALEAFWIIKGSIFLPGFIIIITCIRLSRFSLLKGHWQALKIEFPFYIEDGKRIKVKGEESNPASLNRFIGQRIEIAPVKSVSKRLRSPFTGVIVEKRYLNKNSPYFELSVDNNVLGEKLGTVMLESDHLIKKKYARVKILAANHIKDLSQVKKGGKKLKLYDIGLVNNVIN